MMIPLFLISCQMELSGPRSLSDRDLVSRSSRLIELYIEDVARAMGEEDEAFLSLFEQGLSARDVATRALEEGGREYLEFCLYADSYSSTEEVFKAAESLVSEGDLDRIRADVEKVEAMVFSDAEELSRAMTTSQKKEFYSQLKKMVINASVLLTAAIVYACVPTLMLWGKVSAACAVAVAAGVLASTIMCIIEYYQTDGRLGTFDEWLKSVTVEPNASWAIAAAVISTNSALGYSPVLVALILGVFGIYGIIDDLKPLLKY